MDVLGTIRRSGTITGTTVFLSLGFVLNCTAQNVMPRNSIIPRGGVVLYDVPVNPEQTEQYIPEQTDQVASVQAVPVASPVAVSYAPCENCQETYGPSHRTGLQNLSETTCFNCRTNGSYKFPVPRQYTYFWPGIYSQKTMTEYIAPYRGLKLRSPSEVFDSSLEDEE